MQDKLLSDRYLVQEEIGKGGMGSVYRAVDLRTGGSVAIKIPHAAYAGDATFLTRLQREAQIAAQLYSPRVVRIIDVNKDEDGMPYLVMEYVPGPTLGDELRTRGRLPWAEALTIASEIARALDAGNQKHLVHQDLKPHNIKLIDGEVKVLDFGIARAEGYATANVGTMFMATPEYCAPERLEGFGDIRADIYALGVMLFEMLAGYPPFTGRNPMAVMEKHASLPPPPLPAEVPSAVAVIVQRCLEKEPAQRFPTPRALIEAIADLLGITTTHNGSIPPVSLSPPGPEFRLAQTAQIGADIADTSRIPLVETPTPSPAPAGSQAKGLATPTLIAEEIRAVLPAVTPWDAKAGSGAASAPRPAAGARSRKRVAVVAAGLLAIVLAGAAGGAFVLRGSDSGPPRAEATTPAASSVVAVLPASPTIVATATVSAPTPTPANTPAATPTPAPTATPMPTPTARPLPPVVAAKLSLSRARNADESAVIAAVNAANRFALESVRRVDSTGAENHFRGQALTDYRGIVVELQRLGRYVIDDMTAIDLVEIAIVSPTTARLVSREQHTYDEYSIGSGAPVQDPTRHYQATLRWTYDLVKVDGRWLIDRQENVSESLNPR